MQVARGGGGRPRPPPPPPPPAGLDGIAPTEMVHDMIASALEKSTTAQDEIHRSLALSLARTAAVPYGQVLGNDEMENMVNSLFACPNVNYTPDGKKILAILPQTDIDRLLN